jgi:hypothetical protein
MDEEEPRAPDSVVISNLYDSDIPDTLEDRINQLLSHGLSPEEAEAIARSQMETARNESRIMNLENTVEILKEQMKAKERERQRANKLASEASSSSEEAELRALETKIKRDSRNFNISNKKKIGEALIYKKENGIVSQMEISDQELNLIEKDINDFVNAKRISKEEGEAIKNLFTTPFGEDSDYEGYNSGYDTSGGRRTRKARKSRKSRKSKKSKKSRKTRKNKRK